MKKIRDYELSPDLLESYQSAALNNACELLAEAKLLLTNNHVPRAYFLALASIEEAGKAYIAFDAKGRNLKDDGLCNKIKIRLEDHSNKISSAFFAWISFSDSPRDAIEKSVELMIQLKHGREKSMYIDVKTGKNILSIPNEVVRPIAAQDCVRLAENCIHHTQLFVENNMPMQRDSYEDKLLCINLKNLTEMHSTEDFWEYYIAQLEQGENSYAKSVVTYHDVFYKKKKSYIQKTANQSIKADEK